MHVKVVSTDELGDRSYVGHDGEVALVIDPQPHFDHIEAGLLDRAGREVLVDDDIEHAKDLMVDGRG